MGLKLTLKYYHDFADTASRLGTYLNTSESWDVLRSDEDAAETPFYIPEDRLEWAKRAQQDKTLTARAKSIAAYIDGQFSSVNSIGSGGGYLEFLIKQQLPVLPMHCSDYTPRGIERLRKVFVEAATVTVFDMLKDDWPKGEKNQLCLMYRIDTVFTDEQWRDVFGRMQADGVPRILFIPSQILDVKGLIKQQTKRLLGPLMARKLVHSGYIRTQDRFASLWNEYYQVRNTVPLADLIGFDLKRIV